MTKRIFRAGEMTNFIQECETEVDLLNSVLAKICSGTEKSVEKTEPDRSNSKDADGIVIDNNDADCFEDEKHDPYDISDDNIDVC